MQKSLLILLFPFALDLRLFCLLHLVGFSPFYRLQIHVFQSLIHYQFQCLEVTDSLDFISALFMVKQQLWFDLFCLFIIISWNLLGFTIMLLSLNHIIATSLFYSNSLNNSFKSLFAVQIVLSSAKFASFASFIKSKKSLINILNKIGPWMDP